MKKWSWVKGGIALGILNTVAVLLVKPLGVSTEYVTTDGMLIKLFSPDFVINNAYLAKYAKEMTLGYGTMVVIGMLLGALLSVLLGGQKISREEKSVPSLWASVYGNKSGKRYVHAFIGGFLLLFGARLADGCTSGHVISGMAQLSISGFIFAAAVFIAGIPTARIIYRKVRG